MERWEREGLRSANYGMRNQIDHMLDALAEQRASLPEVREQLAATRCSGASEDALVEVTVEATGILAGVRFTPEALRRTPEQLAESVLAASRHAVRRAQERTREIMAPVVAAAESMPDLPDLIDGVPGLRAAVDRDRHQA